MSCETNNGYLTISPVAHSSRLIQFKTYNCLSMIKNYFKIAWRNMWKNKAFTSLNLGGLTISLSACLIIFLWIKDELNYENAASNADRVFRVALTLQAKNQPDKDFAVTAPPLAGVLEKDFPEIEKAVRITRSSMLIGYRNEHFYSTDFIYADSSFFDVFGFPMIKGNPRTALLQTNQAVISESMAKKYFGSEEPVGKTITINDTTVLIVSGVAKDLPATTHFHFDVISSFKLLGVDGGGNNWWYDSYYTYLLLKDAATAPALNRKIKNIMDVYNGKQNRETGFTGLHFLQPVKSIHLHSNLRSEIETNGSISSLRIFIGIAIFFLVVACINYVNLTTATSFKRAKEIGMRKVTGATFSQLVSQFLSESVLIALIALFLSIALTQVCLPLFNRLAGTQITLWSRLSLSLSISLVAFAILLGIGAGFYPAFYLSQVKPIKVFKNIMEKTGSLLLLRKVLVIFQFSLSIILIIATIIALQQLDYMQSQSLGFDKEQVLTIPLRDISENQKQDLLKKEFTDITGITVASASSSTPGRGLANIVILPEGVPADQTQTMNTLIVDYDFINTYKMSLATGRNFSKEFGDDSTGFVLNETAVKELGWGNAEKAVGKKFEWGLGKKGTIIGVVKDFHFNALQQKIIPVVMHMLPATSGWYGYVSVRTETKNLQHTVQSLKTAWSKLIPGHPFDYFFVDQDYNKQYQSEQRVGNLSFLFSMLVILISCLGLFGLIMVAISQRVKEIGIRKVLGASVSGIAVLLSKDFIKLVAIAILIASPVAWWLMNKWLSDFAYRINISWWVFGIAGFISIFIALLTVSFQAIKAAIANPVKSLRTE